MITSQSSTHKKVVVRKLDQGLVKGFVNRRLFLGPEGVEVLDRTGHLLTIPLDEIKGVYFVRDFDGNRDRPERKVFHSRPKQSGLWVMVTFRDNENLEGLISPNLLELEPEGFLVTPADFYSNNLQVFVPRSALAGVEVLGVISNGTARKVDSRLLKARRKAATTSAQFNLFASLGPPAPDQS